MIFIGICIFLGSFLNFMGLVLVSNSIDRSPVNVDVTAVFEDEDEEEEWKRGA